jgi:glycosyltransferase involved in cell wall biosynthesis
MRIPAKNITIVPHGVILPKTLPTGGQKAKIKTITYLGALAKDKGVEDAIKCFSLLDRNYRFWIIGRGAPAYRKQLKLLFQKMGIADQVRFWGYVSQRRKFELLAKSHLLVNPSIHEGWGLVNIEANSVGTPVVAYRSAGLVDSVNNGISGIIVAKNTPDELAKNIKKILGETKLYEKLQKGAIAWSKNFSWEKSKKMSLKNVEKICFS